MYVVVYMTFIYKISFLICRASIIEFLSNISFQTANLKAVLLGKMVQVFKGIKKRNILKVSVEIRTHPLLNITILGKFYACFAKGDSSESYKLKHKTDYMLMVFVHMLQCVDVNFIILAIISNE